METEKTDKDFVLLKRKVNFVEMKPIKSHKI